MALGVDYCFVWRTNECHQFIGIVVEYSNQYIQVIELCVYSPFPWQRTTTIWLLS